MGQEHELRSPKATRGGADFKRAKDDLVALSKRFKGILDLLPQLEQISSLEDYISEKEQTLKQISINEAQAKKRFEELTEEVQVLINDRDILMADASSWCKEQREQYLLWEKDRRTEYGEELLKETENIRKEQADSKEQIRQAKENLRSVNESTLQAVRKYEDIKQTIERLKAQL